MKSWNTPESLPAQFLKYLKQNGAALFFLISGLHLFFFRLTGYDLGRMIGDEGDSRFIMALTEYDYQWLLGHYTDYWEGFFMYPDHEVISYSDNLLGILPFYATFR